MDRQKLIPPLSTKITRKLAQESADHNSLMNFYSNISRDATGAPKKWKMSSSLHIDEDSITSKTTNRATGSSKAALTGFNKAASTGSNKAAPTSYTKAAPTGSRENSSERKSRLNQSVLKSQKVGRKSSNSRDGSSSDRSSSRESSLESRDKNKSGNRKLKDKKSRSSSSGSLKQSKPKYLESGVSHETIIKDSDILKKKRGRPKSLDLTSKATTNGDDENFKSPDPLTPCNIAVKRKKGRPKETPPILVAEPSVVSPSVDKHNDSNAEKDTLSTKRKPGRPKRTVTMFKGDQFKSFVKSDKSKSYNLKRYEGRNIKQYGSKLVKSKLSKAFRTMGKLSKFKPVVQSNDYSENDFSMSSNQNEATNRAEKGMLKENGLSSVKRKPGRPLGAKNKKSFISLAILNTRQKAITCKPSLARNKFGSQSPGRATGARNKPRSHICVTVSNRSKENNVVVEKEHNQLPNGNNEDVNPDLAVHDTDAKMTVNSIDEAIDAVLFKTRNDISFESNIKPRDNFKSTVFYKKLSSVKSIAKMKKEKDITHKIRKKRILMAHASNSEFAVNLSEPLASNDLRRKLHSKLIQKLKSEDISTANEVVDNAEDIGKEDSNGDESRKHKITTTDDAMKIDPSVEVSNLSSKETVKKAAICEIMPTAKIEEAKPIKLDVDKTIDTSKRLRKQSVDLTKFSDTESVCSERSSISLGSAKRHIEKQVLILGEDSLETEDNTVRTRQRFEIIPGKKRKRTLSGEFDLLDEKQLRKERKKLERNQTDDESDSNSPEIVVPMKKPLFKKMKSPVKKSHNLKVKDGRVGKTYVSSLKAYRNRLLKQSPFLSRVRKRRRKPLFMQKIEKVLVGDIAKMEIIEQNTNETDYVEKFDQVVSASNNEGSHCEQCDPIMAASTSEDLKQTKDVSDMALESNALKTESYRKGLFEKFTNAALENKIVTVDKMVTGEVLESDYVDSDDTECTVEFKDETFSENHDEVPIEESVDDSDTIDFHAEEEIHSTGHELYTDSEIDIREMLFDLIDDVVMTLERKRNPICENSEARSGDKTTNEKSYCKIKLCDKTVTVTNHPADNVDTKPIDETSESKQYDETELQASDKDDISLKDEKKVDKQMNSTGVVNNDINKVISNEDASFDSAMNLNEEIGTNIYIDDKHLRKVIEQDTLDDSSVETNKSMVQEKELGPLPIARRQGKVTQESKVKKKPGRKPKQRKPDKGTKDGEVEMKTHTARKTSSNETKTSPESMTRTFELRQKISRSPLDNIALKQSLEEDEYLRNEAQKASRKIAKLKSKSKPAVQEYMDDLANQSMDVGIVENIVAEIPLLQDIDSLTEAEYSVETVHELLKMCTPCTVVLRDFIKELERAQGQGESESEVDALECSNREKLTVLERTIEHVTVCETFTTGENEHESGIPDATACAVNTIDVFSGRGRTNSDGVEATSDNVEAKSQIIKACSDKVEPEVEREINVCSKRETVETGSSKIESMSDALIEKREGGQTSKDQVEPKHDTIEAFYCKVENENNEVEIENIGHVSIPKLSENIKSVDGVNSNNKKEIVTITEGTNRKPRQLRPKRKTPVKSYAIKENAQSKLTGIGNKKVRKLNFMSEQQTARKTVPPLKIKVKGGFSSKRKTYIVEPSPDSPVEQSNKAENKTEKKKEKSKAKSGNKSESSDSEKLGKIHHHHKKRNKTPTEEIVHNRTKGQTADISQSNTMAAGKLIKPTDAYEATFLQFIQDKDKVEHNIAAFSNSFNSTCSNSNKHSGYNSPKVIHKDGNASTVVTLSKTFTPLSPVNVPGINSITNTPIDIETHNDIEDSEVQYVCSQCENVVYKAKEQIIQHYRDVHPGSQFIYKPLPDNPLENITQAAGEIAEFTVYGDDKDIESNMETNCGQASQEVNDQTDADDGDDSGSLNLKIVDVVSLKDQENIHDSEINVSKLEQIHVPTVTQTNYIQTELRIPNYQVYNAPPPYPVIYSGPPPPYPILAACATPHINSCFQEQVAVKPIPVPVKRRSLMQSGKTANSFKCEKCNVHAPMLAAMVAHLRNSHKEIPRLFQCPYCKDKEAETEALIHQHIKKHHPTNNPNPPVALSEPAKRNLKTLSVRLPEGLKLGEGNCIDKDIYMCLKCKEHMPSLETIYEHLEHEHVDVFAYVCPVCKIFKAKSEDLVNTHIITEHRRSPVDVNISLAIDGTQFVRVPCLLKDKPKSGQKMSQSVPQKQQQPSPVFAQVHHKPPAQVQGQITATHKFEPIPQTFLPQGYAVPSIPVPSTQNNVNVVQPFIALQQQTSIQASVPNMVSKPTAPPPNQKKKKSLLESIQKIKDQKMEEQGLITQNMGTSLTVPSHPSQLISSKPNIIAGGVPPPLMRGPPPLIRYDQLAKGASAQSAIFGSNARTTSSQYANQNPATTFALQHQAAPSTLQRLQSLAGLQNASTQPFTNRSIQGSKLFDTSDLDTVRTPPNQRPVLNVPVVSRLSRESPFPQSPTNSTKETNVTLSTGAPLDLSRSTPTASPIPQNIVSANSGTIQISGAAINPDVFKVFNLKPSTQMQLPRHQMPVQQMVAQPVKLPQQVRQNTPSTLAYRPVGPQMIATSQVPQIIGMPIGAALIGNMVVNLGNVTQAVTALPGVTQIPSLQAAQFVRMTSPQIAAPTIAVLNSPGVLPMPNQVPTTITHGTGQQIVNKNMLFRCPYCPKVVPLRLEQVQQHIENQHPGSSILFKLFDSK